MMLFENRAINRNYTQLKIIWLIFDQLLSLEKHEFKARKNLKIYFWLILIYNQPLINSKNKSKLYFIPFQLRSSNVLQTEVFAEAVILLLYNIYFKLLQIFKATISDSGVKDFSA